MPKSAPKSIGTELLFENDRIRVWDLLLKPGEEAPHHLHQADYVHVCVRPGRVTVTSEDGETETSDCHDGLVEYTAVGKGIVHTLRNSGRRIFREVIVELKGPSEAREPGRAGG